MKNSRTPHLPTAGCGVAAWLFRDAEGWCWFAGRKKHLIVLNTGDNVSPIEVETVILSHPAVMNCAVLGVATPEGSGSAVGRGCVP